jgi:hypothetical protein
MRDYFFLFFCNESRVTFNTTEQGGYVLFHVFGEIRLSSWNFERQKVRKFGTQRERKNGGRNNSNNCISDALS